MNSKRRQIHEGSGDPVHELPDLGDDAFAVYESRSRFFVMRNRVGLRIFTMVGTRSQIDPAWLNRHISEAAIERIDQVFGLADSEELGSAQSAKPGAGRARAWFPDEPGFKLSPAARAAQLLGPVIDTDEKYNGTGSIRFDGDDLIIMPDSPEFDSPQGFFQLFMRLRPTVLRPCVLVEKPGQFKVEIDDEQRVAVSVATSSGEYSARSQALVVNRWQQFRAVYACGALDVEVNTIGDRIGVPGTPIDGNAPVAVGAGFTGNIDDFRLAGLSIRKDHVDIEGLDANGHVRLDENGSARLEIRFTGEMDQPIERTIFCFGPVEEAKSPDPP
jgi:hypothetical protein